MRMWWKKLLLGLLGTLLLAATVQAQDADSFLRKGKQKLKDGKYEDALVYFCVSLGMNDQLYEAWIGRAEARIELEEYDFAMDDYTKAIALAPDIPTAWLGRSKLKRRSGDLIGAAQDFNEGVSAKARAWKKKWF